MKRTTYPYSRIALIRTIDLLDERLDRAEAQRDEALKRVAELESPQPNNMAAMQGTVPAGESDAEFIAQVTPASTEAKP